MPENAMLMLHDPSGLVLGTAADMRSMAEALDKMAAAMVAAYRDKSGRDDAEIEALMQAQTWLSAEEAVELGLADRIEAPVRMAANFDLSRFRNPPPQLAALASTSAQEERCPILARLDRASLTRSRPWLPTRPRQPLARLRSRRTTGQPKATGQSRRLPRPRKRPPATPPQQPSRTRRRQPLRRWLRSRARK
jgi:hypothetical protein